jgi:anti-sigma B factor antagonist
VPDISTLRDGVHPPVVVVEGEVADPPDETQLYDAICAAVKDGPIAVHVDLTNVPYLGSVGINALIRASQDASRLGSELTVVAASPLVRQVLEATGCSELLGLRPDEG